MRGYIMLAATVLFAGLVTVMGGFVDPPVFANPWLVFTVRDTDLEGGYKIGTTEAFDGDGDKIKYKLEGEEDVIKYFRVHPIRGEIFVTVVPPDNMTVFKFQIRAEDKSGLFDTQDVSVFVYTSP